MRQTYLFSRVRVIKTVVLLGLAIASAAIFSSKAFAQVSTTNQQNTNTNLPLVVVNRFEIYPEQRELFLKLAKEALELTPNEPGCITYGFYEQPTAQNSFIYYEEWKDKAALVEHLQKPYVKPLLANFSKIVKKNFATRIYDTSSVSNELPISIGK